jgi:hypothetical protein
MHVAHYALAGIGQLMHQVVEFLKDSHTPLHERTPQRLRLHASRVTLEQGPA